MKRLRILSWTSWTLGKLHGGRITVRSRGCNALDACGGGQLECSDVLLTLQGIVLEMVHV